MMREIHMRPGECNRVEKISSVFLYRAPVPAGVCCEHQCPVITRQCHLTADCEGVTVAFPRLQLTEVTVMWRRHVTAVHWQVYLVAVVWGVSWRCGWRDDALPGRREMVTHTFLMLCLGVLTQLLVTAHPNLSWHRAHHPEQQAFL